MKINFSVSSVLFFFAGGADIFSKRFLEDILQYSVIVNIWEVLKYLLLVNIVNAQNKTFFPHCSPKLHIWLLWIFLFFFFSAKAKTIIIVTFTIIYFVDWCIYFVNVSWCCWLSIFFVTSCTLDIHIKYIDNWHKMFLFCGWLQWMPTYNCSNWFSFVHV